VNEDDEKGRTMTTASSRSNTPVEQGPPDFMFGEILRRQGLSVRDRRIVSIACLAAAGSVPVIEAHLAAALRSKDLTIEELHEIVLHFAVYCGWPKASQLEVALRVEWVRVHEDAGEAVPPWPDLPLEDLGPVAPQERLEQGQRSFEAVNLMGAPTRDTPYLQSGVIDFVFGHVWERPGLTRRERRLITIVCVGASEALIPIQTHVRSALASGDVDYAEVHEVILQFAAYFGYAKAEVLHEVAREWQRSSH
jgi:4-carboxymuconolactone decarboxylase